MTLLQMYQQKLKALEQLRDYFSEQADLHERQSVELEKDDFDDEKKQLQAWFADLKAQCDYRVVCFLETKINEAEKAIRGLE